MKTTKKLIALLIAVITALSLTACGGIADIIGDSIGLNTDEVFTEDLKSKKDVENNLGDNYAITLKYGFSSTEDEDEAAFITTKTVGNASYTFIDSSDGDKDYYYIVGNDVYTDYDEELGVFQKCVSSENLAQYSNAFKQIVTSQVDSVSYNSKSSGTFLGRNVTIYKWSQSINVVVASVAYNWEYIVDDATGLVLKQAATVSGSSVDGAGAVGACFEVTELQIGGVSLADEQRRIAVDKWPTSADFTTFGINEIAKIDGEFVYSNATIEDTGIASEKEYTYKIADKAAFDQLCQSFYNAGFKKNYNGEAKEFTELYTVNEYTNVCKFDANIGELNSNPDFAVELELIPPMTDNGKYNLTISLYNNNAMAD